MENIPEQPTSIPMALCTCSTRGMQQGCAVFEPAAWCRICSLWKNLFCCLIVLSQMFSLTSTAPMTHSHRGNWPPRIKHSCGNFFFSPHIKGKSFSNAPSTGFCVLIYVMHVQCDLECNIQKTWVYTWSSKDGLPLKQSGGGGHTH